MHEILFSTSYVICCGRSVWGCEMVIYFCLVFLHRYSQTRASSRTLPVRIRVALTRLQPAHAEFDVNLFLIDTFPVWSYFSTSVGCKTSIFHIFCTKRGNKLMMNKNTIMHVTHQNRWPVLTVWQDMHRTMSVTASSHQILHAALASCWRVSSTLILTSRIQLEALIWEYLWWKTKQK